MAEHADDFEWRGEGEEAEIVAYAPDEPTAEAALEHALPAAGLPGVESPVCVASSPEGLGFVALSRTHAAPDLVSAPARGLLLVAEATVEDLGVSPGEVPGLVYGNLSDVGLPALSAAGVRRTGEEGARAAAEDGLIEEEDLRLFGPTDVDPDVDPEGDPDALGRRAVAVGSRDWEVLGDRSAEVLVYGVGELFDAERAGELGLEPGVLAVVVRVGAGELGRLALAAHRERIAGRILGGADFGDASRDLPAAPAETGEAADLLAASGASANFADARAALLVYALRRAVAPLAGRLDLRAAWRVGGLRGRGDSLVHRGGLAVAGEGKPLASGGVVAFGTGNMWASAPPFGVPESGGRWAWEEAGLAERVARLDPPEGRG